ncbi:hypothetical protein CCR75_005802 [Bremia lactucae]|uniref:Uncharacterized protein n=1 Tax=Bremia lactucae TaxID=4779 RepID=A0A976IEY5_BRELC|nr:hypothetical protein CCR75_005802 [Bremia lactucae]
MYFSTRRALFVFYNPDPTEIHSDHPSANRHVPGTTLLTSALELQRSHMTAANCFQREQLTLRGHWIRLQSAERIGVLCHALFYWIILMSEFSFTYPIKRNKTWCGMRYKAASVGKHITQAFSFMTVFL